MPAVVSVSTSFTFSQLSFNRIDREIFRCEASDRVFGPRHVFHAYRNAGDADLKMILIYTPGGFEQSFMDREVMIEAGERSKRSGSYDVGTIWIDTRPTTHLIATSFPDPDQADDPTQGRHERAGGAGRSQERHP